MWKAIFSKLYRFTINPPPPPSHHRSSALCSARAAARLHDTRENKMRVLLAQLCGVRGRTLCMCVTLCVRAHAHARACASVRVRAPVCACSVCVRVCNVCVCLCLCVTVCLRNPPLSSSGRRLLSAPAARDSDRAMAPRAAHEVRTPSLSSARRLLSAPATHSPNPLSHLRGTLPLRPRISAAPLGGGRQGRFPAAPARAGPSLGAPRVSPRPSILGSARIAWAWAQAIRAADTPAHRLGRPPGRAGRSISDITARERWVSEGCIRGDARGSPRR